LNRITESEYFTTFDTICRNIAASTIPMPIDPKYYRVLREHEYTTSLNINKIINFSAVTSFFFLSDWSQQGYSTENNLSFGYLIQDKLLAMTERYYMLRDMFNTTMIRKYYDKRFSKSALRRDAFNSVKDIPLFGALGNILGDARSLDTFIFPTKSAIKYSAQLNVRMYNEVYKFLLNNSTMFGLLDSFYVDLTGFRRFKDLSNNGITATNILSFKDETKSTIDVNQQDYERLITDKRGFANLIDRARTDSILRFRMPITFKIEWKNKEESARNINSASNFPVIMDMTYSGDLLHQTIKPLTVTFVSDSINQDRLYRDALTLAFPIFGSNYIPVDLISRPEGFLKSIKLRKFEPDIIQVQDFTQVVISRN
jgi:hypothetical protein